MKRLAEFILLVAILPCVGMAQSIPISGQAFNQYGSPVAGAQVYICSAAGSTGLPCTPLAVIYQDYNLTLPAANPTQTDENGNFNVYVGPLAFPNTYVVNIVTGAGPIYTQLYPGPGCPLSGCTSTGPITATLFNATTSPYFEVNGTQLASTNLLDTANLAYKNASNTFTGTTQTAPIWNATTQFNVAGSKIASSNLADGSNLPKLNAGENTFTGIVNAASYDVGGSPLASTNLSDTANLARLNAANVFTAGITITGLGSTSCLGAVSGLVTGGNCWYQTVDVNSVALTQVPVLNFTQRFTGTNVTGKSTIDLNAPGTGNYVATYTTSPGSSTSVTQFDGNGNLVPCTATSCGGTFMTAMSCPGFTNTTCGYEIALDGKITQWGTTDLISPSTFTFPYIFPHGCLNLSVTSLPNTDKFVSFVPSSVPICGTTGPIGTIVYESGASGGVSWSAIGW